LHREQIWSRTLERL